MKKEIPYHPELRELIPSLGFDSSTKVLSFLRQIGANFWYDRIHTKEDRIEINVDTLNELTDSVSKDFGAGFIFVMDVPGSDAIEVIHLAIISKDDLIKYLKLKVFS